MSELLEETKKLVERVAEKTEEVAKEVREWVAKEYGENESNYDNLLRAFSRAGVLVEEVDERAVQELKPVPSAVKYLAIGVAHLHFDEHGKFLGTECNGDATFVPSLK